MQPTAGTVIAGKYRIDARIGEGAMGAVWRAVQLGLDRPVAVKFLHAQLGSRDESRARFEREARVAASLDHDGSVSILDFGEHGGLLYLVMELLVGESLRARLDRGPLALGEALAITRQIALALAAAHRINLVHRDIKPENIFLEAAADGAAPHVKVVDFGLAFIDAPDEERARLGRLTDEGQLGGTPAYMSPEQVRGRAIGPASDVYSLGCVLYELLSGRPPFVGAIGEVLTRHAYAPPLSLRDLDGLGAAADPLDELVTGMLAKSAPLRPSPHRILAALDTVAATLTGDRAVAPDRQARMVSTTVETSSDVADGETTIAVLAPLDLELALTLAAAGLHPRTTAEDRVEAGAVVWAPGLAIDRLAGLVARGAAVVTDVVPETGRLVELIRAGVAEAVPRPVQPDELERRLRRALRHHRPA